MSRVAIGDPVFLSVGLEGGESDKYVQAFVSSVSGASVSGVYPLEYVGHGVYENSNSLMFPSGVLRLRATYKVYEDPGFLILSPDYYFTFEDFELDKVKSSIDTLVNAALADVIGAIEDMPCILGIVEEELITGEIIEEQPLVLGDIIEDEIIIGEIDNCPDCCD